MGKPGVRDQAERGIRGIPVWREDRIKIIVKKTGPGSSHITREPCCPEIEDAINHCFIDAEWQGTPGGIYLWVNTDMQDDYEWLLREYGEPKKDEMSISFCPFCGKKIEIEVIE
jgi:hypothetical protein